MEDGLLWSEHDLEELEDAGLGLGHRLDVGNGAEELADPCVAGQLTADDGHAVRVILLELVHAPEEDDAAHGQPEVLQSRGMDLARQAEEPGKRPEFPVDARMGARIEQDDLFGHGAEEGLGGFAIRRPAAVDMRFPIPEPAGQDRERAVLEEPIEGVLAGDPLEALALLVETAGAVEIELFDRPVEAIAAGQRDRTAFFAARGYDAAETGPGRLRHIAVNGMEPEINVPEIGRCPDRLDLTVEGGAHYQAETQGH